MDPKREKRDKNKTWKWASQNATTIYFYCKNNDYVQIVNKCHNPWSVNKFNLNFSCFKFHVLDKNKDMSNSLNLKNQ